MKKISVLVLILIIFNFICSSYVVYADEPEEPAEETETEATDTASGNDTTVSMDEYKSIADEGMSTIGGTQRKISLGESDVGDASSKVGTFLTTIAVVVEKVASKFTSDGGFYYTESEFSAEKMGFFTINSLIFGEYIIFNAKAYQTSTDLNPSVTPSGITGLIDQLKERGAGLSRFLVNLALMLALPMILFAIVRTVSAKKASDLAAWKKILVRWALCVFLLIFFQYILAVIDTAADSIIDGFWKMRVAMEEAGYNAFETTVIESLLKQLENTGGVTSLAYSVVFVALVVMQMLFLFKYGARTLGIIFLFIVAPIVIIVHSVNLMLGKESNILGEFFKNYISLVFMQPLHALFYLIFFFSLSEIAINVPILGIILLYALYRASNIAKAMFGWELGSSIFTLGKK